MAIPSFDSDRRDGKLIKPRICVVEVRDRDKLDADPIAWVIVERQEFYRRDERDNSIYEASIRLSYERIGPKYSIGMIGKGSFSGGYSRGFSGNPLVSLTSESTSRGAVFLDLPGLEGQRIGTYLMNEIVRWAQQWPDATVCSVELGELQAYPENKERRNRFYEQFGLVFDYRDTDHKNGLSRPMLAAELTTVETWKANLREMDVREYFSEEVFENERMKLDLARLQCAVDGLNNEIKRAEARPIKWFLRQLWLRFLPFLGPAVLLSCLAVGIYSAIKS